MRDIKPVVKINNNVLTTQPFTPDGTLVDDPVALVDDPVALVGGRTVIIPSVRAQVKLPKVYTKLKKRR